MISINRNNIVNDIQSMDAVNIVNIYNIYLNNQSFMDSIANDVQMSLIFSDFDLFVNHFFPDYSNAVGAVPIWGSDFKLDVIEKDISENLNISDVIRSLTLEDITKIVNAFTDINIPIEAVKEEIKLSYL